MKGIAAKALKYIIAATGIIFSFSGCSSIIEDDLIIRGEDYGENSGDRVGIKDDRKVLLLYSAGFNSLSEYLKDDINDLKQGWLPGNSKRDDILLVYAHHSKSRGVYSIPMEPHLIRIFSQDDGTVVCDTLVTYDKNTVSSSSLQLNAVLREVKSRFPAGSYGMIFSSHATGYLPAGYYSNPQGYMFAGLSSRSLDKIPSPVPYIEPEYDPSLPMVKSIGQDQVGTSGKYLSYEIELADFADAIPMQMDYILFDACLMGGVEVAYELKGKCGKVGFSQAEVLAEGLDYKTLTNHLLKEKKADPQGVCEDYFKQYESQSGVYQSATISLIDCKKMDALAEVCRELFSSWKYKDILKTMDPDKVQRFYRFDKHWFYDLASILIEADIDAEELGRLSSALDECVLYKAHTPEFMCEFEIEIFSGLSMYLPSVGSTELDKYYKTLLWNQDTGLVK